MNILAFDTSTHACTAALQTDGNTLECFTVAPRKHTDLLLPMIDELLSDTDLSIAQLDAIAYGKGPGSFMGVRLAVGVAQGLGFSHGIPLIGISTLQALAQTAHIEFNAEQVITAWDARMQEIYWAAYQLDEQGLMQAVNVDRLSSPDAIGNIIDGEWCAVGNAWQEYASMINIDEINAISEMHVDLYPHAKAMLPIAVDRFSKGDVVAAEVAEPLYLRNDVARKG